MVWVVRHLIPYPGSNCRSQAHNGRDRYQGAYLIYCNNSEEEFCKM